MPKISLDEEVMLIRVRHEHFRLAEFGTERLTPTYHLVRGCFRHDEGYPAHEFRFRLPPNLSRREITQLLGQWIVERTGPKAL